MRALILTLFVSLSACSSESDTGSGTSQSPSSASSSSGSGGTAGGPAATGVGGSAGDGGSGGSAGSASGGSGGAGCITCYEIQTVGITGPICDDNGPPSSKEIFTTLVDCTCEPEKCYSVCQATCDSLLYPSPECLNCQATACESEKQACLDDKP